MAKHNTDGAKAEEKVAGFLQEAGYKILDTNWKTTWSEVDIIAEKDKCIYFVEVKYRSSDSAGSGFDYIHAQKLRKMELAANSWVEMNGWKDEYVLSAAEVSGSDFEIEFIEQV